MFTINRFYFLLNGRMYILTVDRAFLAIVSRDMLFISFLKT